MKRGMIKIENENIRKIASDYLSELKEFIPRRKKFKMWNEDNIHFANYFQKLEEYVLLPPNKLEYHKDDFADSQEFKEIMIFLYKKIQEKYGFTLLKELNIRTCPYCNIHYTYTINSNRKRRPQFDHFYSKTKYPALVLSFFNLIPSCPSCNFTKGDSCIGVNPYIRGFGENAVFIIQNIENCYYNNQSDEDWSIKIQTTDEDIASNIEKLGLDESYAELKDYVQELIFKKIAYNNGYFHSLESFYKENPKDMPTKQEIESLIVGNYLNEDKHSLRPLSKLTTDIWKNGMDIK